MSCWKKIRREPDAQAATIAMLAALAFVSMKRVAVSPIAVAGVAFRTGLSAYDASYLWLAMSNDAELITLDARLARINAQLRELPD